MMSIRSTYLLGFILVCLLLLTSVYLQVFDGILPCPLCSLQRLAFSLLGILFLIGILIHSKLWGRITINALCTITSVLGIFLAGRQVWMQHFPYTGSNECGVSLQYMLEAFPINQVLQKILFEGSAECTKRGWEFLHLNMAEWGLAWFLFFLLMSLYLFMREVKWHHHHV